MHQAAPKPLICRATPLPYSPGNRRHLQAWELHLSTPAEFQEQGRGVERTGREAFRQLHQPGHWRIKAVSTNWLVAAVDGLEHSDGHDALEVVAQGRDGHHFGRRVNLGLEHSRVAKFPEEGHKVGALAFVRLYLGECREGEQDKACKGE
ncbi:MAG: hypothetical protein GC192_23050 [Bacteroidetes bacterium]|nr:hypothetical protein [Bacteroidota bacterium]